jgi:hypothetical protein
VGNKQVSPTQHETEKEHKDPKNTTIADIEEQLTYAFRLKLLRVGSGLCDKCHPENSE